MRDQLIDEGEVRGAIVYDLVSRIGDAGKTQIQKLAYLLQEHYGVPLGCAFYVHQYGPYADEIETAISNLKFMDYVSVQPDPQGYGFHVKPRSAPEGAWTEITDSVRSEVDGLLAMTRSKDAGELEVLTTIHYLVRHEGGQKEQLIPLVKSLKPKFSEEYISRKYDEMVQAGLLP